MSGSPSPRPGESSRGAIPLPSSVTRSSSHAGSRKLTDTVTVPSGRSRNACTTAFVTASETARRTPLRPGSATPCVAREVDHGLAQLGDAPRDGGRGP